MAETPILPDVLAPGLRLVFCGTAAGTVSAARRCYYAHPQNKFWRTLYAVGLTPRLLAFLGVRAAAATSASASPTSPRPSAAWTSNCPRTRSAARPATRWRQRSRAPSRAILAFTSLTAGRRFLDARRATSASRSETIGATRLWLLPSPSPAASWNWDEKWWRALAEAARGA